MSDEGVNQGSDQDVPRIEELPGTGQWLDTKGEIGGVSRGVRPKVQTTLADTETLDSVATHQEAAASALVELAKHIGKHKWVRERARVQAFGDEALRLQDAAKKDMTMGQVEDQIRKLIATLPLKGGKREVVENRFNKFYGEALEKAGFQTAEILFKK